MGMKRDTYQMWKDTGQLPQVLEFIKECSRKLVTQKEMCTYLNLDEATFTRLKKKHPELDEAFHKAKLDLKKDLMGALYKKAIGYELDYLGYNEKINVGDCKNVYNMLKLV